MFSRKGAKSAKGGRGSVSINYYIFLGVLSDLGENIKTSEAWGKGTSGFLQRCEAVGRLGME